VPALDADEVMGPRTRGDEERTWRGRFVPIQSQWVGSFGSGWATEFARMRSRSGLLKHLESLPWPRPESVQVLIHDQDDDCYGLWMIHDGKLVEVSLPRTQRFHDPAPPDDGFPQTLACCGGQTHIRTCPSRLRRTAGTRVQPGRPGPV
jgi:hypothetical protein